MSLIKNRQFEWRGLALCLLCAGCFDGDPAQPAVQGSIVGTLVGPMLGGTPQFSQGIQVQAAPDCAIACGVGQTTTTQSGGRFQFGGLVPTTRYVITVFLPDSLMMHATDQSSKAVTVRPNGVDTVNFKLAFAPRDTLMRMDVAPVDTACQALMPRRCLLVRFRSSESYMFFYDAIEGFSYEPGFEYTLSVMRSRTPEVPADAGLYRWRLVEVTQKRLPQ